MRAKPREKITLRKGTRIVDDTSDIGRGWAQPTAFGQVVLIQLAAAVDSLWPLPGFGQFAGAVMLRIGMVMMRSGSQTEN